MRVDRAGIAVGSAAQHTLSHGLRRIARPAPRIRAAARHTGGLGRAAGTATLPSPPISRDARLSFGRVRGAACCAVVQVGWAARALRGGPHRAVSQRRLVSLAPHSSSGKPLRGNLC